MESAGSLAEVLNSARYDLLRALVMQTPRLEDVEDRALDHLRMLCDEELERRRSE